MEPVVDDDPPLGTPTRRSPAPERVGWIVYGIAAAACVTLIVQFPRAGASSWVRVDAAGWVIVACLLVHFGLRTRDEVPRWGQPATLRVVALFGLTCLAAVGMAQELRTTDAPAPMSGMFAPMSQLTVSIPSDQTSQARAQLSSPTSLMGAGSFAVHECPSANEPRGFACWVSTLPTADAATRLSNVLAAIEATNVQIDTNGRESLVTALMPGGLLVSAAVQPRDGGSLVTFAL